ncbi:hypothetical protein Bca4012_088886 [Brassica carinata]|uniref:Uncharacterized protein n=4 Tax=Brassica TaxID=3705 RepID=A0A0D3A9R9_BRAOL|nr:PREDICTED: uncharacterized protein LOC106335735 [Brassica oleracea var. oleracea]XP_048601916.1 precursor of CEP9 [Brassica napus]KAG2247885.1 hypothetical protein Bca52824_087513 [Brassica carinata]VDD50518.1 unnamed protein product [Brassica oleracea]CAF2073739.1 unnamed protein product [Brassica napus]CDY26516.1 BnaC01g23830D [Brassica napus]
MKLLAVIVTNIIILIIFDQAPITTEARKLRKTIGQDHFKAGSTGQFVRASPGNKPGIGHKKDNANVEGFQGDFKPTEGRKLQKTNGKDNFKPGVTDDFAPTAPGNSPGVGHKKAHANVKGFKDDFKPKEGKMFEKMNDQYHLKTGTTDDFAPTSPGNSPGMGHKKGDDFKPTTPGHSPGIGHAVKNDEPKA